MSIIESAVVDMAIQIEPDSENEEIKDEIPSESTKSAAAMPLPAFGLETRSADLTT